MALTEMQELSVILTRLENKIDKVQQSTLVIDKRLDLIEQRLGNIERWIPVENTNLMDAV